MSYGYSTNIIQRNNEADPEHIGVRLGKMCISRGVPVSTLADGFGVSRQTIYNWFCGGTKPKDATYVLVEAYLSALA